ncbi:GGDEF domain-containing protein [bacterium]|nr:GGDEF domain-containing protein [candidate division CSSED10-310 bacterium]
MNFKDDLTEPISMFVKVYPFVLLMGALLLSIRFHRSKLLLITLLIILCDQPTRYLAAKAPIYDHILQWYLQWANLLIPLNIVWISFLKNRRISSFWGFISILFLPVQVFVLSALYYKLPSKELPVFKWSVFTHRVDHITSVSDLALLMIILSFLCIIIRFTLLQNKENSSYFWILICLTLAFLNDGTSMDSRVFYGLAGLIVLVTLIELSYGMAYQDELTGLPGRRAMNESLTQLGNRYCIAMVDIDHFKKINDTYGHDAGDQVLKMIAAQIKSKLISGKAFRYGGEEFALLYPGKTLDFVRSQVESIRQQIGTSPFFIRSWKRPKRRSKKAIIKKKRTRSHRKITVTVSIGVAENQTLSLSVQDVIKAADKELYKAKRAGRNRVSG